MVQSRSFHTRAENWLTGKQVEGAPPMPACEGSALLLPLRRNIQAGGNLSVQVEHAEPTQGCAGSCPKTYPG